MKAYYLVYDVSGAEWVKAGQVSNVKDVKRIVNGLEKWVVGYMKEDNSMWAVGSEDNYTIHSDTREKYPGVYNAMLLKRRIKKAGTK